ncbi:Potassium transporter 5, partial [Quaeritorhiza haematococci]
MHAQPTPINTTSLAPTDEERAGRPSYHLPTYGNREHRRSVALVEVKLNKKPWRKRLALAYGSLGVIFGDIGTSPLYAMSSAFYKPPTSDEVLGILSLIIWALIFVFVIKYTIILLSADDNGEGGIFALYALLSRQLDISVTEGTENDPHTQKDKKRITNYKIWRRGKCKPPSKSPAEPSETTRRASTVKVEDEDFLGDQLPAISIPRVNTSSSIVSTASTSRKVSVFRRSVWMYRGLVSLVLFASGMVIGDGILTPAISVLSAVEGIAVPFPAASPAVVPVAIVLALLLFLAQKYGTHRLVFVFSPIILIWFLANTAIGIYDIVKYDGAWLFKAFSPHYAVEYLKSQSTSFGALGSIGSIFLVVTGAGVLYEDLGHFDRLSLQLTAIFFAFPSLVIIYTGQAARVIVAPESYKNIYWEAIPGPVYWPMLVLSVLATIVASQ